MGPKYIKIPQPQYDHHITYNHFEDEFQRVARNNRIKVVYTWLMDSGNTWLGFLHGGLFHVFEIPNRFTDMKECIQAVNEGFPNCTCEQWRKLKELGYRNEEEADRDRGSYTMDRWIEIRSQGYRTSQEFDREKGTGISREAPQGSDRSEPPPDELDVETYQFQTAIIDGNNIAWGDYEDYPKFKFLTSVYNQLRELGVKPYVVVSAALRHRIDQPIELVEILKQDDVAEAPANRPDDFFIIQLAIKREAFIVSNDRFKDWKKANPELSDTIEDRRVALTFIEDEPQFDHKLYKLIKRPKKYT